MPGEVSKKLCNLARATPGSATGTPPFSTGGLALKPGTRALGYGQGLALLVHPTWLQQSMSGGQWSLAGTTGG